MEGKKDGTARWYSEGQGGTAGARPCIGGGACRGAEWQDTGPAPGDDGAGAAHVRAAVGAGAAAAGARRAGRPASGSPAGAKRTSGLRCAGGAPSGADGDRVDQEAGQGDVPAARAAHGVQRGELEMQAMNGATGKNG